MKTIKSSVPIREIFLGIIATMMMFFFVSCSQQISFLTSTVAPAAEGKVVLNEDKNNNYVIKIEISNLAEVEKLQPPKKSYIVWMESDQDNIKNLGQIISSNNLKASFESVSNNKPTRIMITAEEDENAKYPGSMVVLTTQKF